MRPDEVTVYDNHKIFLKRYGKILNDSPEHKPKFHVGQVVRLRLKKLGALSKGYSQNYSSELYRVTQVISSPPTFRYHLEDLDGNKIKNTFYFLELFPVFDNV